MERAKYLRELWKRFGGDEGAIIIAEGEDFKRGASRMLPPIPGFGLEALIASVSEAEAKVTELARAKLKRWGVPIKENIDFASLVGTLSAQENACLEFT